MSSNRLFVEVDSNDEDSVATDSTASDAEEIYPVERILSERLNQQGDDVEYLVKWEGYPLAAATWEPRVHVADFGAEEVLGQWRAHLQDVQDGNAELFDVSLWDEAYIKAAEEKEIRLSRRKAKRKKRGIPVSPSPSPEPIQESNAQSADPSRSPNPDSTPVRPTPARYHPTVSHSSDSEDPLARLTTGSKPVVRKNYIASQISPKKTAAGANKRPRSVSPEKRKGIAKRIRSASPFTQRHPAIKDTSPSPDEPLVRRRSNARSLAVSPDPERRNSDLPIPSRKPVTAVRNSLPTINVKKQPVNIFAPTGKVAKPGKRGAKSTAGTTRDDRPFRKLSIANHYHKLSRNDDKRAPDFSSLTMIDPATGKTQPATPVLPQPPPLLMRQDQSQEPAQAPQSAQSVTLPRGPSMQSGDPQSASVNALPSVYARRSPKQVRRERSPSPPHAVGRFNICSSFSRTGYCPRGAACPNAHIPDPKDKRNYMCRFWFQGYCNKSAAECKFLHGDAPYTSTEPGTWGRPGVVDQKVAEFLERCEQGRSQAVQRQTTAAGELKEPAQEATQSLFDGIHPRRLAMLNIGTSIPSTAPEVFASETTKPSSHGANVPLASISATLLRNTTESPIPGPTAPISATLPRSGTHSPLLPDLQLRHRSDSPIAGVKSPLQPAAPCAPKSALQESISVDEPPRAVLSVEAGAQMFTLDVRLDTPNTTGLGELLQQLGKHTRLELSVDRMVAAADLAKAFPKFAAQASTYPIGNIVADAESVEKVRQLSVLAEHRVAAFVGFSNKFTILCYKYSDHWKILDDASVPPSSDALRFRFGPALNKMPLVTGLPLYSLLDLDETRLFPKKEDGKVISRSAMIILPPDRQQESTVLAKYLSGLDCQVFHFATPGAWNRFRNMNESCRILFVDPDVQLHQIRGLSSYLPKGATFSWGINSRIHLLESKPPTFSCERLFPRGEVVFITDETILYHPTLVVKVIRFLIEIKAAGAKKDDKIATRPGIKDWLLSLIIDHKRSDLEEVYGVFCKLCPFDKEDPDSPGNPSESAALVSPPLEEFENSAWWQVKDSAGKDPRSTGYMIEWFAGWSSLMAAHKYRHFTVIHQEKEPISVYNHNTGRYDRFFQPDPQKWGERWQHLTITVPEQLVGKWRPPKKS